MLGVVYPIERLEKEGGNVEEKQTYSDSTNVLAVAATPVVNSLSAVQLHEYLHLPTDEMRDHEVCPYYSMSVTD